MHMGVRRTKPHPHSVVQELTGLAGLPGHAIHRVEVLLEVEAND
jgi:hypothetical protein